MGATVSVTARDRRPDGTGLMVERGSLVFASSSLSATIQTFIRRARFLAVEPIDVCDPSKRPQFIAPSIKAGIVFVPDSGQIHVARPSGGPNDLNCVFKIEGY